MNKILLINNGTIHITELESFINGYDVKTIKREDLNIYNPASFDAVILSGSSEDPVVENPKAYVNEINLIKTSPVPVIGICMGFEVIAYAYNAELKEMPFKESGLLEIKVTGNDRIFEDKNVFEVVENHRWAVTDIKRPLIELARSKDGIEALKHESRPVYGFQFHPEIFNEKSTGSMIFNNLLNNLLH